jgi:drug/metabolite transporter (DMT)-like permease
VVALDSTGRNVVALATDDAGNVRADKQGRRIGPGIQYMAAGAVAFSVMSLLVKVAGHRLPSVEIVLVRAAITTVLSYALARRAGVPVGGHDRRLLATRGLVGFCALTAFYFSVVHLPLADATVIQYTNPLFATLLAVPLLGETIVARDALSVLLGLAGVVVVARPSFLFPAAVSRLDIVPVAIGLGGAVLTGAAYVLVRKLRASEDPLVIVFHFALVSTIASIPLALPVALWPTPREWAVLAAIGVTTQLGQVFFTRGLHLERAGRATAVGYLQIVCAAVWGGLAFGEIPDWGTVAGAVLIVGSTLVAARGSRIEKVDPA